MIHRLTTPLVLAALAAAQSPAEKAMATAQPPAAVLTAAWQTPLVDSDPDGTVWVAGPTYKAQFRPQGVQFLPFLGSDLPANVTLDLTLDAVRLGGQELPVHEALAQRRGSTIDYERGACRETFRFDNEGLEQLFTFDHLPVQGDLDLSVRVQTPLRGQATANGLEFVHERGAVRYSAAIAIDARGRRLPLPTTLEGDHIRFAVPAAFVAEAALPLVIDPLIGTLYTGPVQTYRFTGKDLAFDATANEWQVVWSYLFSATDSDVKGQRFTGSWSPLAGPFTIDITTDSWFAPSIANLNQYDRFLCVAQEVAGGTSRIVGRITTVGSDTPVTAQFDIEGPGAAGNLGLQAADPDVGGDSAMTPPTYWTVVYQVNNAGNADIRARQITDTGTLRGTTSIAVAATTDQESRPRISKSAGRPPFATQTWGIVWNNDIWQIFGRPMSWNGALGASQTLFSGVTDTDLFDVSSPTDDEGGQRRLLLTFEYDLPPNGFDIVGVVMDRQMAPLANPISLTERCLTSAHNAYDQKQPSVDSDGVRFVVGFQIPSFGNLHAGVFNLAAGEFGLLKAVQTDTIAGSLDIEVQPVVCAVASGGGGRLQYGLAWTNKGTYQGTVGDFLQASAYEGRQGGNLVTSRTLGCGGLGITHSGQPVSGETLTVNVLNGTGLVGLVVGFPTTQSIPGCSGCTQGVNSLATFLTNQFQLAIPRDGSFVGMPLAFQGFNLGIGPCLAQVSLSDALDATIR